MKSGLTVVASGLYREYRRHSWTTYPSARPIVKGSAWLSDHRPSGLAAIEAEPYDGPRIRPVLLSGLRSACAAGA
jgi:hypothetical protein